MVVLWLFQQWPSYHSSTKNKCVWVIHFVVWAPIQQFIQQQYQLLFSFGFNSFAWIWLKYALNEIYRRANVKLDFYILKPCPTYPRVSLTITIKICSQLLAKWLDCFWDKITTLCPPTKPIEMFLHILFINLTYWGWGNLLNPFPPSKIEVKDFKGYSVASIFVNNNSAHIYRVHTISFF